MTDVHPCAICRDPNTTKHLMRTFGGWVNVWLCDKHVKIAGRHTTSAAIRPSAPTRKESDMGMYDHIAYTAPCPFCGEPLTRWQSKDGECELQHLTPPQLWKQSRRGRPIEFYDNCDKCGTWVEIHAREGTIPYTADELHRMLKEPEYRPPMRRGPVFE